MTKYRKRPIVVEAVQLRWDTWSEVCELADVGGLRNGKPEGKDGPDGTIQLAIPTKEGVMLASENDWIIKGVAGEVYPWKPEIFEQTYEAVGDGE